jgi:hypothetical protein
MDQLSSGSFGDSCRLCLQLVCLCSPDVPPHPEHRIMCACARARMCVCVCCAAGTCAVTFCEMQPGRRPHREPYTTGPCRYVAMLASGASQKRRSQSANCDASLRSSSACFSMEGPGLGTGSGLGYGVEREIRKTRTD